MSTEHPTFDATVAYLFALKARGPKFGIDRMRVLAAALGHPELRTPCIHVAGTNGKGSVSAMLDAILRAAGWRCGLYTSPHLVHVGERVAVDRVPLSPRQIMAYVDELRAAADRITAADPDLRPSFFEWMTAMAFLEFARQRCDVAVYETGLGGRLDATNIVRPELTVITSIGLDHCEYLGNELTQIAAEKAGIIKPGVPVVIGRMPRAAEKVIRTCAAQIGAPAISVVERFGESGTNLPESALEGDYQRWNAATATLAAEMLPSQWKLTPEVVRRGLQVVEWAGRWQRVRLRDREVILDASHNPEGAAALDANLCRLSMETGRAPIVIVGILGRLRAEALVETIARHAGSIHLVVPAEPRACPYDELESLIPLNFKGPVERDTLERLFPDGSSCNAGRPGDTIVVTGSIYLVGEVMLRLRGALPGSRRSGEGEARPDSRSAERDA